jgi:hypothetical protein
MFRGRHRALEGVEWDELGDGVEVDREISDENALPGAGVSGDELAHFAIVGIDWDDGHLGDAEAEGGDVALKWDLDSVVDVCDSDLEIVEDLVEEPVERKAVE